MATVDSRDLPLSSAGQDPSPPRLCRGLRTKLYVAPLGSNRAVSSGKANGHLEMLADALRACPCMIRGLMSGRDFGARGQHMPRWMFSAAVGAVLPGLSVGGRSVLGTGSDDAALTPAVGWLLATIRRKSGRSDRGGACRHLKPPRSVVLSLDRALPVVITTLLSQPREVPPATSALVRTKTDT